MALYTDEEIRKLWRESKDKEGEIEILSQLTLYSKARIRKIIAEDKKKMEEGAPARRRELEAAIIRYYVVGWHIYEIANIFNVTSKEVVDILNRHKIELRHRRKKQ